MPKPIGPDYLFDIKTVSDPHVSPDGTRVAFTVSWVERERAEARSRVTVVHLTSSGSPSVDGSRNREFTQGNSDDLPRWAPNGERLAFRRLDAQSNRQLWVMPSTGGEGRQVTDLPGGVLEFAWASDSRRLAVVSDVDRGARSGGGPKTTVVRRIRYHEDGFGLRSDKRRHIFVVDIAGGEGRQITGGDFDNNTPVWSPDGTRIAFISARSPERDVTAGSEAYVVQVLASQSASPSPLKGDAKEGEAEGQGEAMTECWSEGLFNVGGIGWSPDGTRLVVIGSESRARSGGYSLYSQGWLYVLQPGAGPRQISDDSVRPVVSIFPGIPNQDLVWTNEGSVLFLADARGESVLCSVPHGGGPVQRLTRGGAQITRWSIDRSSTRAGVAAISPASIGDIYALELSTGRETRLTAYNDGYFAEHPAARLEKFTLRRAGFDIECRVWLPPDFERSKRYPLLLEIHGGPQGVFYDAFAPQHQIPATNGYVVLAVNPRGSSTYGFDFTAAVHGDWGGEDYLDLMAAVDEVCKRPYVDASKLVVGGYSYGGYMTSWIVGQTDRFKAAVVGAPVTNLESMYGTSDIGVSFGEVQWGGTKFDRLDWYRKHSPISYVTNVTTPVLLMHGEDDRRCPIEQSEQYFVALKRLGKEVELVRFPGCSHGLLRFGHPGLREEYFTRMLGWFDSHIARTS